MKKGFKSYLISWAVLLIIFNIIVFAIPGQIAGMNKYGGAFWSGYILITLTLIGQFICAIVFAYLSGCFYPINFFPASYQKMVGYLPFGAGFSYIRQAFGGNLTGLNFAVVMVYGLLFMTASVLARKMRVERSGR